MSNEFTPKTFWEKPEGTTAMITIGGLALAAFFFLGPVLAGIFTTMIGLLGQAITITALSAILFALIMVLSNSKFQSLVGFMFKGAMRKITGAFVEIDPIGIMRSYIGDLKKKQGTMDDSIDKLQGQVRVCEKQVNMNDAEYERQMSMAKVAHDKQNTSAVQVASRQAMRLEKLNKESLKPLLLQMQVHLKALRKYREVTDTVILDITNEVAAQEMQRKLILESYSAMTTAKKILMGGTDQKELFDQAMEFVVNDYGMKMGAIENFIENSKGFVDGLDLQNGVYEEEAMKRLQEWENKASDILLGNTKQQLLEHTTVSSTMNMGVGIPAAGQVDYSELLSRK